MIYDKIWDRVEDDICEKYPNFSLAELNIIDDNRSIEKGRYKPIICYAITPEDSFIVSDFFVVCVDKASCTDFIGVEYDQQFGKNGIWRYI